MRRNWIFLLSLLFLTACAVFPMPDLSFSGGEVQEAAAAPLPTPDRSRYTNVQPQACLVNRWETMQTDLAQGDLVAWSPDGKRLAYVTRQAGGWFTGQLAVADWPDFERREVLVDRLPVSGDLTWSPDGRALAFVALREDEKVYTVMVYHFDTRQLVDLFPESSAKTDEWGSQKGILRWTSTQQLLVAYNCGSGCQEAARFNAYTGARSDAPQESYLALETALAVPEKVITYDAEQYPKMTRPNWSPDGRWAIFRIRYGEWWLLDEKEGVKFQLDLEGLEVEASVWSPDSSLLAVRTEGDVWVFSVEGDCQGK